MEPQPQPHYFPLSRRPVMVVPRCPEPMPTCRRRRARLLAIGAGIALSLSGCVSGEASRLAAEMAQEVEQAAGIAEARGEASTGGTFESVIAVTATADPGVGPGQLAPVTDAWRSALADPEAREHSTSLTVEGIDGGRTLQLTALPEEADTAPMLEAWGMTGFTRLAVEHRGPGDGGHRFTAHFTQEVADPAAVDAAEAARWGGDARLGSGEVVGEPQLETAGGEDHSGRVVLGGERDADAVGAWQALLGAARGHDGEPMTSSAIVWEEDGAVSVQIHVSERRGGGTPTPSPGAAVPERATSLCDDAHDAVAGAVGGRGYAVECSWEGERVLEESGP